jgi:pimeloyl-ACP methyl ester carboxylesterase
MLFPYHVNHLALNWQVALHRGVIEYFARYFTVINLDFRGSGLSERRIAALSLDTFIEDFAATLQALGWIAWRWWRLAPPWSSPVISLPRCQLGCRA